MISLSFDFLENDSYPFHCFLKMKLDINLMDFLNIVNQLFLKIIENQDKNIDYIWILASIIFSKGLLKDIYIVYKVHIQEF